MKVLGFFVAIAALMFTLPADAASVEAKISLSNQRMYVSVNGVPQVHLGGLDRAERLPHADRNLPAAAAGADRTIRASTTMRRCRIRSSSTAATRSTAPMRSAASDAPVSHGCVRLAPGNAATLYSLVGKYGMGNTRVIVTR